MKKEFSKFFIASLKRTAQNISPRVRRKQTLLREIAEREEELATIQKEIDAYDAPIKEATNGYGTEDLVERVTENTGKVDKNGNPIKLTKWNLKYPDTVVPVTPENDSEGSCEDTTETDEPEKAQMFTSDTAAY